MIPVDLQIRAQINTTHFQVNSVVDSGTLPETAPKGNHIVTLKSYRYALEEEAGFAWVAWNGRSAYQIPIFLKKFEPSSFMEYIECPPCTVCVGPYIILPAAICILANRLYPRRRF